MIKLLADKWDKNWFEGYWQSCFGTSLSKILNKNVFFLNTYGTKNSETKAAKNVDSYFWMLYREQFE